MVKIIGSNLFEILDQVIVLLLVANLGKHLSLVVEKSLLKLSSIITERIAQVFFDFIIFHNELKSVGLLCSILNLQVRRFKIAVHDVLLERVVEEKGLLLDEAKPLT